MPVTMDDQLKEHIPYDSTRFPISFFHDELADLPQWNGPLHWHSGFEIATAENETLDYQVVENTLHSTPETVSLSMGIYSMESGRFPVIRQTHCRILFSPAV